MATFVKKWGTGMAFMSVSTMIVCIFRKAGDLLPFEDFLWEKSDASIKLSGYPEMIDFGEWFPI